MIIWEGFKAFLKQNQKVATNLPAYGKDVNDYSGSDFPIPCRCFKCCVDGWYSLYWHGLVGEATPYVKEYCVAGMDYVGYFVNIKDDSATPGTLAANIIIAKW